MQQRLRQLVRKVSVEAALSIGATALADAEKMTNLLGIFGEGGEKRAQGVVDRAAGQTTEGRNFPQFLLAWEKDHCG